MYISSFHIDGFGLFSNTDVDELSPGISVFLGNNEAGKSTCLEFLRAMLTGYPARHGKKIRRTGAPLAGGKAGGSLVMVCHTGGRQEIIRLVREPGPDGLHLYSMDGQSISPDRLGLVFSGVSREVYHKVFGFSLGELEQFESLNEDGVRNALYGASFGGGILSPAEALARLQNTKKEIFAPKGMKPSLNAALRELESIRGEIGDLRENSAGYDLLCEDLELKKKNLAELRAYRKNLENDARMLERRLGVWRQWEQLCIYRNNIQQLEPESGSFPEDAASRLARIQEACDNCERNLASRRDKIQSLRKKRQSLVVNAALLADLPVLRTLAERKNSYRQALSQVKGHQEAVERAQRTLEHNLAQLGSGWDCNRIRNTERSLFAREDIAKNAREMNAAALACQAAMNDLEKAVNDVQNFEKTSFDAKSVFENLPVVVAELNDSERDELRQNVARLEESRRLEPARQRAYDAARSAFNRALEQIHISCPRTENGEIDENAIEHILDEILNHQNAAMELAGEMQTHLAEAANVDSLLNQAVSREEEIKRKIDLLRLRQNKVEGSNREKLESKSRALRELRNLSANIEAGREKLSEIDTRLENERTNAIKTNWLLLFCAFLFTGIGGAIFALRELWGMTELSLSPDMVVPLNLWSAYLALICGVIMFAAGNPGWSREKKRQDQFMAQMLSNRNSLAARLDEYIGRANAQCITLDLRDYDPVSLEAYEMKLEREREQCFHLEIFRKEIDECGIERNNVKSQISTLQNQAQNIETEVQQCRRKWHALMQNLQINVVPLPEHAGTIFARAEAARIAFDNVANAGKELDSLWEDMHLLENCITNIPAITQRLQNSPEPISLMAAVKQTLDDCRTADLVREKKIAAQAAIEAAETALNRARGRQEEAAKLLEKLQVQKDSARKTWTEYLVKLGFDENLDPETVREAFKFMENCLAAEDAAEKASRDLEICQAEIAAMRHPLQVMLEKHELKLLPNSGGEPDWLATLDKLLSMCEENFAIDAESRLLEKQMAEEEVELGAEEAAWTAARTREKALFEQAGVDNANDFLRLARQHGERIELARHIKNLESSLALAADKQPLADFLESFKNERRENQEARLEDIKNELDEIANREQTETVGVGALERQIQEIANTEKLSILRQKESQTLEDVERYAQEWSRYALAEALLEKAKLIFESERQPEVIRDASQIFCQITNGRWRGISASLEKDSRLMVLRQNGDAVAPEQLSRGTQEQAYLALRLAYIKNHAEHAQPLPVIMDEILVNFDPDRAERAARAFADLAYSDGTAQQILYFTCQPFMVDILRSAAPSCDLYMVENGHISRA